MHGKAQLFWSQGLRARLLPDSEELTDEEIVEGEDGPEELVAVIPGAVWDKIRDRPNVPAEILCAADLGGKAARILVQGIIARELSASALSAFSASKTTVNLNCALYTFVFFFPIVFSPSGLGRESPFPLLSP